MNEGHDLVRPYIMTGGRTRAQRRDLRIETMLQTKSDQIPPYLPEEQQLLLDLCLRAQSVAEADQILVTKAVFERAQPDLKDSPSKAFQLKGFDVPIELYAA